LVTLGSNTLHYAATFKQHEVLEVLLQNPQVRPIGMGHGENGDIGDQSETNGFTRIDEIDHCWYKK